jgi:amino acid adenylation domain-containing protein
MQEGMLFHALVDETSLSYFEQMSYQLHGRLDICLVKKSLNELFKRHDILRTAFVHKDLDRPMQVLLKNRVADFYFEDISKLGDRQDKETFTREFKAKDKKRSFDLSADVLLRLSILRVEESGFEFIWSFHHILMDGWCIGILNSEFFEIYSSYLEDRPYRLPGVKSYRTYIQWLREQDIESSAQYWENYLADYEALAGIPKTSIFKKEETPYRNEKISVHLDIGKTTALNRLAAANQVTLNTVTQALWGILLGKYNDREDVVYGAVVSGRPSELEGVESIVGLFINTIPVRIQFAGTMKFTALLQKVQEAAVNSESHHYNPLADIQAKSILKQNLIDHLFAFENYPVAEHIEGLGSGTNENDKISLRITNVNTFAQSNYNFNVAITAADRLMVSFMYNGNQYDRDYVARIGGHFLAAIDRIIENQDLAIQELEFLTEVELSRILYDFNKTETIFPKEKTIHHLFEEQAAKTPDHVGLVGPVRQFTITYHQLNGHSNRLAEVLIEKGVKADTIVGIMMERSIEMIVGILGILKSGGAYLPIDPEHPQERIQYILEDSNAKILLEMEECPKKIIVNCQLLIVNFKLTSLLPMQAPLQHYIFSDHHSRHLAYIIYTSGTTGRPKGVMIDHGSIFNAIYWRQQEYKLKPGDRTLQLFSFAFDGFLTSFFTPIVSGAMVVQLRSEEIKNVAQIKETIASMGITHFICVPSLYRSLLEVSTGKELMSLKTVTLAGEQVQPDIIEKSKGMQVLLEICNEYGPTEGSVVATFCRDVRPDGLISIGKPIANVGVYIIDRYDNLNPIGIIGQLAISGEGLARGYLNKPELTIDKFTRSNSSDKADVLYKTGDLARWLETGVLEFIGRFDHQVKIRGFRIELGEIESRIQEIQGIKQACVIEQQRKSGERYLCAYIVTEKPIDPVGLKNTLGKNLPDYMIPFQFIPIEKIPLTPNGKVDTRALRTLISDSGAIFGRDFIAPKSNTEKIIGRIWEEVLELDEIGVTDNFFEIGGTSLDIIRVTNRLKEALRRDIPVVHIFQYPNIAALAEYFDREERDKGFVGDDRLEAVARGKQDRMRRLQKKRGESQ